LRKYSIRQKLAKLSHQKKAPLRKGRLLKGKLSQVGVVGKGEGGRSEVGTPRQQLELGGLVRT